MFGTGVLEAVLLIGSTLLAFWLCQTAKWRYILIALPVIWLATQALYAPLTKLTGGHDSNGHGHHWWTDPWSSPGEWTPLMKWWMWVLFIGAIVAAIVAVVGSLLERDNHHRQHGKLLDIGRLLVGTSLVLAVLGGDWGDPVYNMFGTPREEKPAVKMETLTCAAARAQFDTDLATLGRALRAQLSAVTQDEKSTAQTNVKTASDRVEADKAILVHPRPNCLPAEPTANFSAAVTDPKQPLRVTFDASGSTGDRLEYEWILHDPNRADSIGNKAKVISFTYSVPGQYDPELRVTDVYGQPATISVHITLVR